MFTSKKSIPMSMKLRIGLPKFYLAGSHLGIFVQVPLLQRTGL